MAFYRSSPDNAPMYVRYFGNGHHFKDKRPNVEDRPGALWEIEGPHPGMEHFEASLRQRLGDRAERALDLASSEPVNINVFPNLHILGNHIQVSTPVSVDETDTTWYGTAVVDEDGELEGTVDAINALRMRTQESFPNFGEVDDLANFEQIQEGLLAEEDEWVYMHRGLGLPERFQIDDDGVITGPPTDEVFMREHMQAWKRLMMSEPRIAIAGRSRRAAMSAPDPSTSSYYVSDDFYAALIEDFSDWRTPERAISDAALRDSCARFLAEEARLLDEDRLDAWLALFVPECIYWVPGTRHGDPRREIAIAFDDRRRLEDRIFRLRTGEAWSQRPRSRTARMVSNIELFSTAEPDVVMVRSNFLTVESAPARPASGRAGRATACAMRPRIGRSWSSRST